MDKETKMGKGLNWRREWQPTPVFSPGESHGQGSLTGCCPWDCKELDTTQQLIHTYIQDLNRYFSKKDTQTANKHEEMLNITNRRGSTNQTHNETLPRVCQDGHRQTHRRQALTRRSGDPGALLGEMRHEAAAIENSVEGSSPEMFR